MWNQKKHRTSHEGYVQYYSFHAQQQQLYPISQLPDNHIIDAACLDWLSADNLGKVLIAL